MIFALASISPPYEGGDKGEVESFDLNNPLLHLPLIKGEKKSQRISGLTDR